MLHTKRTLSDLLVIKQSLFRLRERDCFYDVWTLTSIFLTKTTIYSIIMIYKSKLNSEVVCLRRFYQVLVALIMIAFFTNVSSFAATKKANEEVHKETTTASNQMPAKGFLIKQGMSGENVKTVQNLLLELGYNVGTVDGVFGQKTFEAVRQFQLTHNLIPDGIVGELTLSYLRRGEPIVDRNMRSMSMSASAYSAHDPGNGNTTATGSVLRKGLVAVDPNVIPLGTRLYIPGYGNAIADDVGGSIKGNRIDLAFDTHSEALQFGRQEIVVYIIE